MSLHGRLLPDHRRTLALSRPWPACAQSLLGRGAFWLHGPGWGGDLLALPGGPRLESRWREDRWVTTLDGLKQRGSPFEALESAASMDKPWLGALSFELACWEAGLPGKHLLNGTLGMAWQSVAEAIHVADGRAEIWSWGKPPSDALDEVLAQACALSRAALASLEPRWDEPTHHAAVEAIRARILDGGFYVANLCVPFEAACPGDLGTLAFSAFRGAQPPYGAFLPLGDLSLLCLSMERVLGIEDDLLVSEPIKGSAARTGEAAVDAAAGSALLADEKEGAEHVMIVDLVRNDLGRVSETGTVRVSELMALHAYPTVQHLVSRVEAHPRAGVGLAAILRSVLPGGSVTGAPKMAVCAHLAEAEAAPRGFYCGALGWLKGRELEFALPIRTAQIANGKLTYWAGGGITLRSQASKEWSELHLKTKVMGSREKT